MAGRLGEVAGLAEWRESARYLAAREIVLKLRAAGHAAYFAGGCVRDMLLGLQAKDFDVATSATPEVVIGLFEKTFAVGAHFGVVLVCLPGEGGEIATEVATFRNDGVYTDGRRPDAVQFSTEAREDVVRRDFTINGMLLDPVKLEQTGDVAGAVLDFVGGREDLTAGVVRAIGDARVRFAEDKLRMLRGVRFAARLGFAIEAGTIGAMQERAHEIRQVSCERIREELTRMLTEGRARRALELMDEAGLLREVLREAVRMHGVEQPPEWHPEGDVWVHTMLLLEGLEPGCSPTLAWGALLHDIGKPATFQIDRTGSMPEMPRERIRFSGHVEVGVRVAEEILRRLRFSNEETEQIVALVKNHMRFGDVLEMRESTLKRFLRLPKFDEHLQLHWLDCTACHGRLGLWEFARAAKARYEAEPGEAMRPKLLVTGRDLIANGYKPGPRFKEMLEAAEDWQLEGLVTTTEEGVKLVRERFGDVVPAEADAEIAEASAGAQRGAGRDVFEVVVIGAGMAGLTCARALAERGLKVLVLEARERVGGRIATVRAGDGEPRELGAEFVHGRPAELMALIAEAGCEVYERDGAQVCLDDGGLRECDDKMEAAFGPLEELKEFSGEDMSFIDYLDREEVAGEERGSAVGYVEGFNAADARVASVRALGMQQVAEDAIGGDRVYRVRGGYDQLPEYLARRIRELGGEVRTGVRVRRVLGRQGRVELGTDWGEIVAKRAVITLPLGVLLRGDVEFFPKPEGVLRAAAQMRMGEVCRFTMMLRERFWEELEPQPAMRELSFLFTLQELPSVWWTVHPELSRSLTGWVGGPRAEALLGKNSEELGREACAVLGRLFGVGEEFVRGQMLGCYAHDWSADEFSRGAYSYVAVGGAEASRVMSEPVDGTLYFAGEHTDVTGHWGTVHGAMRSGLRAAGQVLGE